MTSDPASGYLLKGYKDMNSKRCLCYCVNPGTTYNSKLWKQPKCPRPDE